MSEWREFEDGEKRIRWRPNPDRWYGVEVEVMGELGAVYLPVPIGSAAMWFSRGMKAQRMVTEGEA